MKTDLTEKAAALTTYVAVLCEQNRKPTEEEIARLNELTQALNGAAAAAVAASDAQMIAYEAAYTRVTMGIGQDGDTELASKYIEYTAQTELNKIEAEREALQQLTDQAILNNAGNQEAINEIMSAQESQLADIDQRAGAIQEERLAKYAILLKTMISAEDAQVLSEYADGATRLQQGEKKEVLDERFFGHLVASKDGKYVDMQQQVDDINLDQARELMGFMYANDDGLDNSQLETSLGLINALVDVLQTPAPGGETALTAASETLNELGDGKEPLAIEKLMASPEEVLKAMQESANAYEQGEKTMQELAAQSAEDTAGAIVDASDIYDEQAANGANSVQGIIDGIGSKMGPLRDAAMQMAAVIDIATRKRLDIKSPSRVMRGLGAFVTEGFAMGIRDNETLVKAATEHMAGAVTNVQRSDGASAGRGENTVTLNLNGATIRSDEDAKSLARTLGSYVKAMNYGV